MRLFRKQRQSSTEPSPNNPKATEPKTPSSPTKSKKLPFAWPSGNSYESKPFIKAKPTATSCSPKELSTKEEKATGALSPSAFGKDVRDDSTATSATALALREAAKHCIRGQDIVFQNARELSETETRRCLATAVQEYQAALYILEKTILGGTGVADKREYRSLLVASQIFYWMGLAFQKLANAQPSETAKVDAAKETYERNAIQSFLSCLRLRYHLVDRGEEEKIPDDDEEEEKYNDADRVLTRFLSSVMDIQLVLTDLWESSSAPYCNMTVRESARKLQCLRIATWNEDRGDHFLFTVKDAEKPRESLDRALVHYTKALETFSDENYRNDTLLLKIASCYRQSGLRKMIDDGKQQQANRNDRNSTDEFDTAVFWYRLALKALCSTVRFAPNAAVMNSTASAPTPIHPASPAASVSSIAMSSADSLDGEDAISNEPDMSQHPTYERIIRRIEEILSWKQHLQNQTKQGRRNSGNADAKAAIERETTIRQYLRSKIRESISHQIQAESMLSPTAAWRRRYTKNLSLPEGVTFADEAASTMSSMSVLANALIQLRASLRIEEAVWGECHTIARKIRDLIESVDEEYIQAEEKYATASADTQRVKNTSSRAQEYREFYQQVEDLAEENKRLRTALNDSISDPEGQQKAVESSNRQVAPLSAVYKPSFGADEVNRPVEYVDIISSQATNIGNAAQPAPATTMFSLPSSSSIVQNDIFFPGKNDHFEMRCQELEKELEKSTQFGKDLSNEVRTLTEQLENQARIQETDAAEKEKLKDQNFLLVNRMARTNEELKIAKAGKDELVTANQKIEELLLESKKTESDLQVSKDRCIELESQHKEIEEEKSRMDKENKIILDRCTKAESQLETSKSRCIELESDLEKCKEELKNIENSPRDISEEKEDKNFEERCIEAEANLETSKIRCSELESDLEKYREELLRRTEEITSLRNSTGDSEVTPQLLQETLEKSLPEEHIPEGNADQTQILEEENDRLVEQCAELEKDIQTSRDESEKLACDLLDDKASIEEELRISKNECAKLEAQLDEWREKETSEKLSLTNTFKTRISQLEKDIETMAREGDGMKEKFEKEREELNEKLKEEQRNSSVLAEEQELRIAGLKMDIETALENKKESENRINQLEEELDEAKKRHSVERTVFADHTSKVEKDLEEKSCESPSGVPNDEKDSQKGKKANLCEEILSETNIFKDGKDTGDEVPRGSHTGEIASDENLGKDDTEVTIRDKLETDVNVENANLALRVTELMKELETTEEKGRIEKERLEKELMETIEREKNRVNELELVIEKSKQEQKIVEEKLQNMKGKEEIEADLSARVAEMEEEKLLAAGKLKEVTDQKEEKTIKVRNLESRVSELEKYLEESKADAEEQDQLRQTISKLEKENRISVEDFEDTIEAKDKETNQPQTSPRDDSEDESYLKDKHLDEPKRDKLQEIISSLEEENRVVAQQLKDITEAKDEETSQTQILLARVSKLERELEDSKMAEIDQDKQSRTISELEVQVKEANNKKEALSSQLKTVQSTHENMKKEHDLVNVRCIMLENELQESKKSDSVHQDFLEQIASLEDKLESSTRKNAEFHSKMESFEEQLRAEQDLLEKAKGENQYLTEKYTRLEQETKEAQLVSDNNAENAGQRILSLIARCTELEKGGQGTNVTDEVREAFDQRIAKLEEDLNVSAKKNADINSEMRSLESKLESEQKLLEESKGENRNLNERYSRLQDAAKEFQLNSEKEAEDAGKRILGLLKSVDEVKKEKDTIAMEFSKLEESLKNSIESNTELSSQIESLTTSSQAEKEDKARVANRVVELEQELKSVTERNDKLALTDRNTELERELELAKDESQREKTTLSKRITDLEDELENALAVSATMKSYVDEENEKIHKLSIDLENNIESLQEKNATEQRALNEKINELEKELESVGEKNRCEKDDLEQQIATLERAVVTIEKLNTDLSSEVDSRQDDTKELRLALARSATENQIFVQKISTLQNELESISAKNMRIVAKNETIEKEAKEIQSKLEDSREEQESLMEQLSTMGKALGSSMSENKELNSKIKSYEEERKNRESTVEENEGDRQSFTSRIAALEKEIETISAENDDLSFKIVSFYKVKEENENLSTRVSALEEQLKSSSKNNKILSERIQSMKNLDHSHKRTGLRIADLENELEELENDLHSSEHKNDQLTAELKSIKTQNQSSEETNLMLSAEIESLRTQIKSSEESNRLLSTEVKSLKAQNLSSEETNHLLSTEIESLNTQKETCISGLELELESQKATNKSLCAKIDSFMEKEEENRLLEDRLSDLETDLNSSKERNKKLFDEIESFREKEQEHERMMERVSELETEANSFEAAKESLVRDNQSLREKEEELIRCNSHLETELEASKAANKTLNASAESLRTQHAEHIGRISDLSADYESSQEKNLGLAADVECLQEQQKEHLDQISDLEMELKTSHAKIEGLTNDIESLKNEGAERRGSLDEIFSLEKELRKSKVINESLATDIESLFGEKQDYERMKNRVSILEDDIEEAKKILTSQEELIQEKDKEIASFTSQILKLESDLELSTQESHRFAEGKKSFDSVNENLLRAKEESIALQAKCDLHDKELHDTRKKMEQMKLEAEEEKRSLLIEHDTDRKEKEDLATRCIELEKAAQESLQENRKIASLLRQKSSQIEALNQSLDDAEDLKQKASEYDAVVHQCSELEDELLKTIEFNEGLTDEVNSLKMEVSTLNTRIFDSDIELKEQVEELQNAQDSNTYLTNRCSSLERELKDVKNQHENLARKIAYPDSVEDGHEWTRLQLGELENRMQSVTKENEVLLSRLEEYKTKNKSQHRTNLEKSKSARNLVNQCKELEEELFETVQMNDELQSQVQNLKKQTADWKVYAENIENELEEESEALQDAEKTNADLLASMNILDQQLQEANDQKEQISSHAEQSKVALAHMLEAQSKEQKRLVDQYMKLEMDLETAKTERDKAKNKVEMLTDAEKDLQKLLEEAVQDIHELEEANEKLNAVTAAKNQLKQLYDKALSGKDEINNKYNECKQELTTTRGHLDEANAEKDELNRKLDIEKSVSAAYKSGDESEFDELYRAAREEVGSMEMLLEESRASVADLEENVQILQHQLEAALKFKLQQPKKPSRPNRKLFAWRGGNRNETKGSGPVVVSDDDVDDHDE